MIVPEATPGVAFGTATDGDPRSDEGVRRRLADALGLPPEWAWVRQVHGSEVSHPDEAGIGAEADAIISTDPKLPVAVSVADCLPVAILAPGAVAMVHAGWRGAAAGVVANAVSALTDLGHPPEAAVVGPGIGPCCFEVGPEVTDRFAGHTATTTWGTPSVDLVAAVVDELAGLRVETIGRCSHHDDAFHSYRRTGTSQRQFGVAWVTRG